MVKAKSNKLNLTNRELEAIKYHLEYDTTENNYLYYLSTKSGATIFSKTLSEHNLAVLKYLK